MTHEGEREFDESELFYSRTDPRGVIQSANAVFFRIAAYDPEELIGAPHRLVRHPDMPRGLFALFWSRLRAGKSVGAYVKNRAKDGRHYWVYAVTRPVAGGYLSVRMKPTSETFGTVRRLYGELLDAEAAGLSPDASAALLVEWLAGLGYRSYDAFMAGSLRDELAAKPWARDNTFIVEDSRLLSESVVRLSEERQQFFAYLDGMQLLPTNLRVLSGHLGNTAGALREISTSYMLALQDVMKEAVSSGSACGLENLLELLDTATFDVGVAQLQSRCILAEEAGQRSAVKAGAVADSALERELALLRPQVAQSVDQAQTNLRLLSRRARELEVECSYIGRKMFGLDQIRLLGEIESDRGAFAGTGLKAMMTELEEAHRAVRALVATIHGHAERIRDLSGRAAQAAA